MKIAVCTGGGDCPGLNAAIRAVVKHASFNYKTEVIGIYDSFSGFLRSPMELKSLQADSVTEILTRGGTILGTDNSGDPFAGKDKKQKIQKVKQAFKDLDLSALIVIGGEGTQGLARELVDEGLPIIGIPKTIDNDLPGTEQTIGFSTAQDLVAESVLRLQSTAESHDRIMVLEVMGRDSGFIALHGALAGGAHVALIPEIPYDINVISQKILDRKNRGRNYSVVVVSEGATEKGKSPYYMDATGGKKVLGGVGQIVASDLSRVTGMESRITVLGHLQRGGEPNAEDRILASKFGVHAVDLAMAKNFGRLVVLSSNSIKDVHYSSIRQWHRRKIDPENQVLKACEAIGISLGR